MTPSERSLQQHQQQQSILSKSASSSSLSGNSFSCPPKQDPSHNGSLSHDSLPSLDNSLSLSPSPSPHQPSSWPNQYIDRSTPDMATHRPSQQYTSSDNQQQFQEQQSKQQQQQQRQQRQRQQQQEQEQYQQQHNQRSHHHQYQDELPPFPSNSSQNFEASHGRGEGTFLHSPGRYGSQPIEHRNDQDYPTYAHDQQQYSHHNHHWPTQQERGPESFNVRYSPHHSHSNSTHMQQDHSTSFHSPASVYGHQTHERRIVDADRSYPRSIESPTRHQDLSERSRQSTFPSSPAFSVQEHDVSETRLDCSRSSSSGPRTNTPSIARMSPAGDMYPRAPATYTHHSSAPSSDRHYVLTSSISSTSITQHRLAMSQQHQRQQSPVNRSESSSHLDSASRTSLASSPSAGHSTATSSHANSADVSPATTTSSSSRTAVGGGGGGVGGDQFKLDVMPKEKTPRTPQRIPPPILTQWKSDDATRDCPPLSFQSNSSQSVSTASAGSKMSPSTPRSTLIHSLIGRPILDPSHPMHAFDKPYLPAHTAQTPLFLTESPVGYNETSHSYREDHDMEHCSEQDDVRAREHGEDYDDDDDDEEDEDENQRVTKRAHLDSSVRRVEGDDGEDGEEDVRPLTTSSPKTSVANSPQRDLLKPVKKATRKAPSPRRAIRPSSAQATTTDDSSEHMEDGGNGPEGSGTHSLHGKGLGFYAPLLCERVQAKGTTTLNELIHELAGGQPGDTAEMSTQDQSGQGNIRRRVYDALNILVSLGIISMDKRAIRWIGIQNSYIIREATKRVGLQELLPTDSAEGDRADESEEPEDDDMDIEQLQKEVDALRLQNQMEKAKIEDQIARHVQVNNLIRRNKLTEEKETERLERRRVRKLEKKAERRAQETKEGSQIPGDSQIRSLEDEAGRIRSDKKSHRHHRHRSPRAQSQLEEENDDSDVADMPRETRRTLDDGTSMEVDSSDHPQPSEDEARRLRKAQRQERRERRERKEKRAQRRQERESAARIEHDRIGLPCIVIRMPGYGAQSSDSEGCISVVRRVREEPRPRKSSHGSKSKHLGGEAEEEIDMMTTVEVKVSQQEELSVISDTEILSELRLHDLQQQQQQQQQQGMLPPSNHTKSVARHATATIEELEKAAAAAMLGTSEALAATASDVSQVQIPSVPGFERQMLQDHI